MLSRGLGWGGWRAVVSLKEKPLVRSTSSGTEACVCQSPYRGTSEGTDRCSVPPCPPPPPSPRPLGWWSWEIKGGCGNMSRHLSGTCLRAEHARQLHNPAGALMPMPLPPPPLAVAAGVWTVALRSCNMMGHAPPLPPRSGPIQILDRITWPSDPPQVSVDSLRSSHDLIKYHRGIKPLIFFCALSNISK